MACAAIPVDKSFKERLAVFPWVNWSEVAKEEIFKEKKRTEEFEEFKRITSKSNPKFH